MKDIKGFEDNIEGDSETVSTAEDILAHYFKKMENGLDLDIVNGFSNEGKAVFLLDGLDEIDRELRDIIINSFATFINRHPGCKMVLSSRPHGLDGDVIERFGEYHIKILPLNMGQVEDFISRWFRYVYDDSSKIGGKTAEDMIGEVGYHSNIGQLINNPLMLTAICMLYHDGNELPGQRAELYDKFVCNLLYKRFPDEYEKINYFLMSLAFRMHTETPGGIDREPALRMLGEIYGRKEEEAEWDYKKRLSDLFDRIEPDCGLLIFENGQYNFRHLTFQEFLTATAIVDKETDYKAAIEEYWGNEYYNEVIELYIGYLSIKNKRWANMIIEESLKSNDQGPYKHWLLAAKSLLDIHADRREIDVVKLTKTHLGLIMESDAESTIRAQAGETLGWLGDNRDLKAFVPVKGGSYQLSNGIFEIKGFEIGKYLVTNQWFGEFISDGGYNKMEYWSEQGKKWLAFTDAKAPQFWHDRQWNCPNAPVVGVCWYEAYAFIQWLNDISNDGYTYSLPDEHQWEAAAAGFDKKAYPWGNEWADDRCNSGESGIGRTSTVGIFEKGNTASGICDLAGNLWEWTLTDYNSDHIFSDFPFEEDIQRIVEKIYTRTGETRDKWKNENDSKMRDKNRRIPVFRGGSWYRDKRYCRSNFRNAGAPGDRGLLSIRLSRSITE